MKHILHGHDEEIYDSVLEASSFGDNALNYKLYGTAPNSSQYTLFTALWYFGYELQFQ